jgi:cephalosporin hydroxylase
MHRGVTTRTTKGLRRLSAYWNAESDLDRIAALHTGRLMNKWKHYFEIYDRHLARFRGREVVLLEIGVESGGSLELWRQYLGTQARIVGIDVNPKCKAYESAGTHVALGSQNDRAFLENVVREFGPFDIVIDDGSHKFEHQLTSFRALFPQIAPDGIYACEDLCTSYWQGDFGGGVRQPGTFVEFLKELIDEMNAWFWRDGVESEEGAFARSTHGIHFYPTLVVIEKRVMQKPVLNPVGKTRDAAPEPEPRAPEDGKRLPWSN